MNLAYWEKIYKEITEDLNINIKNDIEASYIFNKILIENNNKNEVNRLKNLIYNKEVVIFGAGPSLKKSIIKYNDFIKKKIKIAADGTTSALIEFDIQPDIIVTDLDGKIIDQIYANSKGAITIIHSHGDNIDKIKNNFNRFKGKIIGTTQINPNQFSLLNNFGGFTDGDRSVLLALYFQAKYIYLIGFDFSGKIGKYSFSNHKNKLIKIRKLQWCKKIIDDYGKNHIIKYL